MSANDMDAALSGYDFLVHLSKHADAVVTYAHTLQVMSQRIKMNKSDKRTKMSLTKQSIITETEGHVEHLECAHH